MIVTVTPNTSVDRTVAVTGFAAGATVRGQVLHRRPGGKGVNLSLCLSSLGIDSVALGLVGPDQAELFERELTMRGVQARLLTELAHTRENTTYLDPEAPSVTHVRLPGGGVNAEAMDRLGDQLQDLLAPDDVVVLAGSLPPGAPPENLAQLVQIGSSCGARVVVDSHGEPMRLAVEAHPALIKPNLRELEQLHGSRCVDPAQAMEAATRLLDKVPEVLVSLGAAGAIYLTGKHAWRARVEIPRVSNTVGCGDALLAGFLSQQVGGAPPEECLATAVACGGASAMLEVGGDLQASDVARLRAEVELNRP